MATNPFSDVITSSLKNTFLGITNTRMKVHSHFTTNILNLWGNKNPSQIARILIPFISFL